MQTEEIQTPKMKRIAVKVAEDVLKSLDLYVVQTGDYIIPGNGKETEAQQLYYDNSKKYAKHIKKDCKVCALGACFVSLISLKNNFDFSGAYWLRSIMAERLNECFTQEQVDLIETSFEGYCFSRSRHVQDPSILAAIRFGNRWEDETKRLKAIMKLIIKYKGEVRFPKVKDVR